MQVSKVDQPSCLHERLIDIGHLHHVMMLKQDISVSAIIERKGKKYEFGI